MRRVMTVVFPVPAPAMMRSGPASCVTASYWAGLRPSRIRSRPRDASAISPDRPSPPGRRTRSLGPLRADYTIPGGCCSGGSLRLDELATRMEGRQPRSSTANGEALPLGGTGEAFIQRVQCSPRGAPLRPQEGRPELQRFEGSKRMEAQQARGDPLDGGDVDDDVARPEDLSQAALGEPSAPLCQRLFTHESTECRHDLDGRERPEHHTGVLGEPALHT